jgi:radical SAM superfamily enzyme YgiQ (UPF0313 family)
MIDLSKEIRAFPPSDPGPEPLHVGLVFANTYQVAIASLGFQTVHLLAATVPGIVTHRIVLESSDGRDYPSKTLEERLDIKSLDALLVSCPFELDYLHLVRILNASGIKPLRRDRGSLPLVIVGGTAPTANPEPLAPFADAIAIGDAEVMLPQILEEIKDYYPLLAGPRFSDARSELYESWDEIEGVYVPKLWEDKSGRFAGRPHRHIMQASMKDLNDTPSYTPIISPAGVYGSRNLVEISRGCTTRCRFCLISYISPAGRERSFDSVMANARLFPPDQASIGLVSSSVTDHPDIVPIINSLSDENYQVSVSSLKLSTTSREILGALSKAGTKSVTFAPEHGSERIRNIICKEYTYDMVKERIVWAFDAGIKRIKLYFLTGFDEETPDDVKATGEFVLSLANDLELSSKSQGFQFTVGLAPLVPKASTPFQRRAMQDESTLKRKMKSMLEPLKKHPRIEIETESPRASLVQGMLSQGDRGLEKYLLDVSKSRGPILKAWDDALSNFGSQPLDMILSDRESGVTLPWNFLKRPDLGGKSK